MQLFAQILGSSIENLPNGNVPYIAKSLQLNKLKLVESMVEYYTKSAMSPIKPT